MAIKQETQKMKPLKVVHLNASSAGGAFVAAQRLSEALNQRPDIDSEHWVFEGGEGDFHLWANNWLRRKWAFALHALEKLDFLRHERERSVRFAFSHGKTGVNVAAWRVIQQADVVHLHWVNKGFVSLNGLDALLRGKQKVVWTCHDMWPFTGGCYHPRGCDHFERRCGECAYLKKPAEGDLSRRVFTAKQQIFQSSEAHLQFVTPSQWLKDQALKSGVLTSKLRAQIEVIPNPIDTDYFHPVSDTAGIRELDESATPSSMSVQKPFTLMFAAANLGNAAKGFAEFRDLCNALYANGYTQLKALVVGENRLGDLGLLCDFEALGFIADSQKMRDAYWATDVYVTTSHEENLPTTIMESLSCGVPVAAFAVGGIPEMVDVDDTHRTGWLVPKMDVDSLVRHIAAYMALDNDGRAQIQRNCRTAALAKYSAESIALAYQRVYLG